MFTGTEFDYNGHHYTIKPEENPKLKNTYVIIIDNDRYVRISEMALMAAIANHDLHKVAEKYFKQ